MTNINRLSLNPEHKQYFLTRRRIHHCDITDEHDESVFERIQHKCANRGFRLHWLTYFWQQCFENPCDIKYVSANADRLEYLSSCRDKSTEQKPCYKIDQDTRMI